jgi:hypothetical protein
LPGREFDLKLRAPPHQPFMNAGVAPLVTADDLSQKLFGNIQPAGIQFRQLRAGLLI